MFYVLDISQENLWQPLPEVEWILKPHKLHLFVCILSIFLMCSVKWSAQTLRSGLAQRSGFRLFLQTFSALYITSEAPLNPWKEGGMGMGLRGFRGGKAGWAGMWKPLSFASFTVAKPHFIDQMFEYFLYDVLDLIKRILHLREWVIEESGELWHYSDTAVKYIFCCN